MNAVEQLIENASVIEAKIGYTFRDKALLALAFVHRSYVNENKYIAAHNERLEFLGDSVLGMIISDFLYNYLSETPEGELSYLRSRLVEATSCYTYVKKLDIIKHMLLGKGEKMSDGRGRESIAADLFEAIIGSIFLDGGIDAARSFIFLHFTDEMHAILKTPLRNWKASLQDFCQKQFQQTPVYKVLSEAGPDHSKIFLISVLIHGEEELGRGEGNSKKEAQQAAAHDAMLKLKGDAR